MTMFELLHDNQNDLTNGDLAVLADWAGDRKTDTPNQDWKRAFALIREGADLLLRRRARSSQCLPSIPASTPPFQRPAIEVGVTVDYFDLRRTLNDFDSNFYGPHDCPHCRVTVVRKAMEQGGEYYEERADCAPAWGLHRCDPARIEAQPKPTANVSAPV